MTSIDDILASIGHTVSEAAARSSIERVETADTLFTGTETAETEFPDSFDEPVERTPTQPRYQPTVIEEVRAQTSRFSGASWFQKVQEQVIIVGGQGGISSWFTFLAARMFPRSIYTYDPDRVEMVNLAGQLFAKRDIGKFKGNAIADTVVDFSDYRSIFAVNELYTRDSNAAKIMVCGFDNMEARKTFFTKWKELVNSLPEEEKKTCLFIDGRLAAESLQIYCIIGDASWDINKYETECLFSDEEADETVCSLKQTAFMANIIGGLMVNMLVNFCANLVDGCRTIPFYTQYEGDQMFLKLEGGV